ncbi:MAG: T9SS type A sorting domain-containing protein [Melioribacteraceae bacterium]|nr:T9SS type A sorting domain-containing protein [Melioribacteraceae bacterium]
MKILTKLSLIIFFITINLTAQVVVSNPEFATESDSIVIIFDATQGGQGLMGYTGNVYAHTGVYTSLNNTNWQHVIGSWGNNATQPKLIRIDTDLYKLVIGYPREFYGVFSYEEIQQLNFVFRSADGGSQTGDVFIPIFQSGLNVSIIKPTERNLLVLLNDEIDVVVKSVDSDSLFLYLDETLLTSNAADSIGYTITVNSENDHNIIAKAYSSKQGFVYDTVSYSVRGDVVVEELPAGVIDGINYIDNSTVTLVLFAPNKEFIYLIGDFNNWTTNSNYYMKRTPDGERYWITLTGLVPNVEYGFQYLIDGKLTLADPYTEKVLEQEDDQIDNITYPNLKVYPYGLTDGSVSIIEINKINYEWTASNYQRPSKESVVIYELLIRDFLEAHNYQTLIDTLDYLERLGINAIELMPINEFEFNNSWGYNPAFYFAPDKYYGTENALKKFIDEAHKRNIAVLLDVVYNHTFGRSPFVRLYATGNYGPPSAENYWYNVEATHDFNVGYDMNHESIHTRNLIKRVLHHWITEYKVDGFRFDLSKGFTQKYSVGNIGLWGQKDDSRIAILKDYFDYTQTLDPDLYFTLEHFADNSEEKILADYGMMLWGNLNHSYSQSAMGWIDDNSSLEYGYYKNRGWNNPHLITYMESHDEQWIMYKNLTWGRSSGSYNIKDLNTALNRMKLVGAFFFTIPGPKMMWQFEELGYDEELPVIGRTDPKPIHWEYMDDPNRMNLYKTYSALMKLRNEQEVFTAKETNINMDLGTSVYGRRINLTHSTMKATIIGNFNVTSLTMQPKFQSAGMWYDYFLGDSLNVTDINMSINLAPGEFRIYTSKKLETPEEGITTNIREERTTVVKDYNLMQNYPNPFNPTTTINFAIPKQSQVKLAVYNIIGEKVAELINAEISAGYHSISFDARNLSSGVYFYRLVANNFVETKKLILLR